MSKKLKVLERSKKEAKQLAKTLKVAARNAEEMREDSEARHKAAVKAHKQAKLWAKGKAKWPHPAGHDKMGVAYYHKPDLSSKYCQSLYRNSITAPATNGKVPLGG